MAEWENDEALAESYHTEGDTVALEILFRRHVTGVYSFCRRFLTIREDAEEAVSETWLRAGKALRGGGFRGESKFRTWLFGIARRVCLERLRQPRLPTLSLSNITENSHGDWVLFSPAPAESSELDDALAVLSDDHRLILIFCELEGLTDAEAAQITGRTAAATKSLRARARRALRDTMLKQKEVE